tara:strand:+ start:480 stop:857 length:378 start_codon:yes stop_codon:yes gene_type:complete
MSLQYEIPLFVKVQFSGSGRVWKLQEHFPWKELSIDKGVVQQLYQNDYLYHNAALEVETKVGDGLEALNSEALLALVDKLNERVQAKTKTKTDFERQKCKKSKIDDKQRGLIRSWRRSYGHMEND